LIAIKPNNPLAYKSLELIVIHQYHRAFLYNTIFELMSAIDIPFSDSTESPTPSIPDAIRAAFAIWLISTENNWARFDEEKYLDYKSFLTFPNSKIPSDLRDNKKEKQRWSN